MSASATSPGPAKICVVCREDCSTRPRIRDPQGRYTCKSCAEARVRQTSAPASSPPSPVTADGIDPNDLHEYDLAPQATVAPDLPPLPAAPRPQDLPKPPKPKAKKHASPKSTYVCRNCGYDMRGLKDFTCPECGTITRPSSKPEHLLEMERETVRNAFLKPVIWTGVGLTLAAIFLLIQRAGPMDWALVYGGWLASIPFCLICLYGARIFGVETDGPWYLDVLGMAAITAMTGAVSFLIRGVPSLGLYLMMVGGTWVVMCIHLLDLETWEAIVVGIVSFVARMMILLGLMYAMGML